MQETASQKSAGAQERPRPASEEANMSTTQRGKEVSDASAENNQIDPAGSYFGTDGAGFEHYFSMGSRRMTVVDQAAGESKTFKIGNIDNALVEWAINTIVQHDGTLWEEIRLDPARADVLTGDVEDEEFEARLEYEGVDPTEVEN